MSEYIMQVDYDMLNGTFSHKKREEIVRCRDCKFCVKHGYRLYCDLNAGGFPQVELDGFCAWGERRDPEWLMCKCGEEMETEGVCPSCGRMVRE